MNKLNLLKLVEKNGKFKGGFTTLSSKEQEKLKGGGNNCDCTNSGESCKIKDTELSK
jgi:hypothetical protein